MVACTLPLGQTSVKMLIQVISILPPSIDSSLSADTLIVSRTHNKPKGKPLQAHLSPTLQAAFATAGLLLPEDRIATVAQALPIVRAGCAVLADVAYGETEPASRFRVPQPELAPRHAP